MMRKLFMILITSMTCLQAQADWNVIPYVQQAGSYFASDRVTAEGYGMGMGVQIESDPNWFMQADANLLWLNGNTGSTHLSFGWQRDGKWSPAVMATGGLFFGQRTEILDSDGTRPMHPLWTVGMRIAPVRFSHAAGFASLLEIGAGIGPYNGLCLDVSLLTIGFTWAH